MLYKNTLIKIKKSFERFISLLIIVLVGTGFSAGIQATSPDIISSISNYNRNYKLMDYKIVSTMGLTVDDVNAIKSIENVGTVIPSFTLDVLNNGKAIRVHTLETSINKIKLIKGRMPKNDMECVADSEKYKLHDKITITSDISGKLKNKEFTVVGTIQSPLYISHNYGNTTVGDGKLSSFIFVNKANFTLNNYTEIFVQAAGTADAATYSKEYTNLTSKLYKELVKLKPIRENARYEEIYKNIALEMKSDMHLEKIEKPKWTILGRDASVAGYNDLKSGSSVVSSVAGIFPIFFILIVLLMTTNTMARMIVEERGEIGTMTSLGFKDKSIISTYLFYVLSATISGVIIGYFAGCIIIPKIIYACFPYILPKLSIKYSIVTFLLILGVAASIMTLVTIIFCRKELKGTPAALMRPVPPKNGQTILLEKVNFIWKPMSFTWKVTMRNLFRYKQRVAMTIVGIAGCTALLLTGFGVRDSISGVAEKQYGKIFMYDNLLTLKNETQTISGELNKLLEKEQVKNPLLIRQSAFTCKSNNKSLDFYLIVPENKEGFYKLFNLKSTLTGSKAILNKDGAIISKKLSDTFKIGKGDKIKVESADGTVYYFPVSDVTQNHIQDYIYMDNNLYSKIFSNEPLYNIIASNYSGNNKNFSEQLINSNLIVNVNLKDHMLREARGTNESLNSIVILLICIASILMVIVLYNLTSINISERKREIATLKVLGFKDLETNEYIYREAFILTLLSILIGLILGIFMHRLMMDIINGSAPIQFFIEIKGLSYLWTILTAIAVSSIMQIITYDKLRSIDMIESLKSVE